MIIIPSADITMFVQLEHNDLEVILERNGRLGSWNHFRTPTESIEKRAPSKEKNFQLL